MKINVNNKAINCTPNSSIHEVINEMQLPQHGIALALNNQVVPKTKWKDTCVNEGDDIIIIKAVCGG